MRDWESLCVVYCEQAFEYQRVVNLVWITEMSEREEIENWVAEEFAELADYGFLKPVISHDSWTTVIDWVGTDIALELEIDWREFDAFFLLVKVEDGQLSLGYYVSNGKPCRYHLQAIVKERAWPVDQAGMKAISGKQGRSEKPIVEKLKKRIIAYKVVVIFCLVQIIAETGEIFAE